MTAVLRPRSWFIVAVGGYFFVYLWSYQAFLEPWQGYWGFSYHGIRLQTWLAVFVLALLPAIWTPIQLRRPSQLLYLFQYLVLYVPSGIVLLHSSHPRLHEGTVVTVLAVMCGGLAIMALPYAFPVARLPSLKVSIRSYWFGVGLLALALLGAVAMVLSQNFRLVSLADIYDVRSEAADIVAETSRLVSYAQFWLAGAALPLLFSAAFKRGSWHLVVAVGLVYIFLFGVAGTKTALLALPILAAIALAVRLSRSLFPFVVVAAICVGLAVPSVFTLAGEWQELLEKWYVVIVHARIFGVPQLIIAQYLGFFAQNPLTFWSHVTGIGSFVSYPYLLDVPRTLGDYYYGSLVGLNAGLWVQDGIAAAGLPGILVASTAAALVFWLLDSLALGLDLRLTVPALGVVAISFTNGSLPTTLLTGGLLLLMLLFYLMPRAGGPATEAHVPDGRIPGPA